jgi:hypothetical protein
MTDTLCKTLLALGLATAAGAGLAQTAEPPRPLMLPKPRSEGDLMRARDYVAAPSVVRAECPLWGDTRALIAAPGGNGWSLDIGPGYFDHAEVVNPASLGAGTLLRCHYRRNAKSMANAHTGVRDEIIFVQLRNLGPGTDAGRCRVTERVVECQR